MDLLFTLLATVVALGLLVTIHEYGHFWVARRCGVKVLRFSVGFGPALYSWHDKRGTEYAIASIPLGGYVKMLDEREGPVDAAELDQAFNRKTVQQRIAVVAAGPVANFLLAIVAFWLIAVLGITTLAPVLGPVEEGSVAARAGLVEGLEVVEVDGTPTRSWQEVNLQLIRRLGETGQMQIKAIENGSSVPQSYSLVLSDWLRGADQPDPIRALGLTTWQPDVPPLVGEVSDGGAAQAAGLRSGDLIVSINGDPVDNWLEQVVPAIQANAGRPLEMGIERDSVRQTLTLVPQGREHNGEVSGFAGLGVAAFDWPESMIREIDYNPLVAIPVAVAKTWDMTILTLESLKKMLTGLVSAKNLSGPITIAKVAGASAKSGPESFLNFIAYLSISLGVLNLLPIPVLDGGHLVYYTAEWIRGKPLSERLQAWGLQIGVALIAGVMLFAIFNDISRLGS
ncbi:RIP metalloprotease RseP [Halopseudomonas salina]|uniref:Zinc metalloprotease n=1 Tax=Halopseudomonas salina TaxID=1323744 RepID=A0ABQ1NVB6_9GAMM|nr:RIP metalloprotease RseP [Halopseudomonas salina]GGC85405.1 zinc metalloprotease [Halopseudomonas salina]